MNASDGKPRRVSSYAQHSTAILLRKLESHRAMIRSIEGELARRAEAVKTEGADDA